jgi:hypothetical protein
MRALILAAVLIAAVPVSANKVVNGDFEAGDFTGWTQFGNTSFTSVGGTFQGVAPFEGAFQAWFGPITTPGGITQTIATTPGAEYSLSFALARSGIANNNFFEVSLGGAVLLTLTDWPASPYTVFNFSDLVADSGETVLTFTFRNNPNWFLLDDVRLTMAGGGVIPEPATWAMLIAGFGLVGGALRRRRVALQA